MNLATSTERVIRIGKHRALKEHCSNDKTYIQCIYTIKTQGCICVYMCVYMCVYICLYVPS